MKTLIATTVVASAAVFLLALCLALALLTAPPSYAGE